MSCERGIPHTKNNRIQSDIYCTVGFTVYAGSSSSDTAADQLLLDTLIVTERRVDGSR